jgi:hypothetical protein
METVPGFSIESNEGQQSALPCAPASLTHAPPKISALLIGKPAYR